jgi:hypothetical protein
VKTFAIDNVVIYEWYDAPLIAVARADGGSIYFVCDKLDLQTRQRHYLAVMIDEVEAKEIARAFANEDTEGSLGEFWKIRMDRKIWNAPSPPVRGESVTLTPSHCVVESRIENFSYPVIDLLSKP